MINYLENVDSHKKVTVKLGDDSLSVSAIRKGAINEHIAKAWLLKQGYEVFANISPEGPADLVAVKFGDGVCLYVDVKSQSFSMIGEDGERFRKRADQWGIKYLVVDDDGNCTWCNYDGAGDAANDNGINVDEVADEAIETIDTGALEKFIYEGEFNPRRQAGRRWVGHAVFETSNLNSEDKTHHKIAARIVEKLIASGRLCIVNETDTVSRKVRPFVRVTKWIGQDRFSTSKVATRSWGA